MQVRALARKYEVSRRTVRASDLSQAGIVQADAAAAIGGARFKPVVDDTLRAGLDAPAKRQHTVKR